MTPGATTYDRTPQGASHIALIMAQLSNAMPTGPETTQRTSVNAMRSRRADVFIPDA